MQERRQGLVLVPAMVVKQMRIGLWMLILKRAMVLQVIFQWMWQQQLLMREGVHAMVEEEGEVARKRLGEGAKEERQVDVERCRSVGETGHALRQHTADCANPTGSCRRAASMPEALRPSLIGCIPDHLSFYNSPLRSELG